MKKSLIKKFKILFLVAIVGFFLLHIIPIPIDKEYDAIEIKIDNMTYVESCTVSLYGKYHFNFLKNDTFEGQIIVSTYPITNKKLLFEVDVIKEYGYIVYRYKIDDEKKQYMFGKLSSDVLLNNIMIFVYSNPLYDNNKTRPAGVSSGWSNHDGYCIVPSVSTREEAMKKLYEAGRITEDTFLQNLDEVK